MNRYLVLQKIVEVGSFTKAAEAMGYTQSSVSQMIASLEEELSLTLLTRSRTGVRLTIEGADLYPQIERTIFQYKAMLEKAEEIRGLDRGIVRIGTFSSITSTWMPELLQGFMEKYPRVQFVFRDGNYKENEESVRIGEVDFAFSGMQAASPLQTITLNRGELLAILPENHPLASQKSVKLKEIAEEPFILLENGKHYESLEAFHAEGLNPNVKYTVHDDFSIEAMVEAGLGISILSELMLRRSPYRIIGKPLDPPLYRTLSIVYRDKDSLPIASKYFLRYLKEKVEGTV